MFVNNYQLVQKYPPLSRLQIRFPLICNLSLQCTDYGFECKINKNY